MGQRYLLTGPVLTRASERMMYGHLSDIALVVLTRVNVTSFADCETLLKAITLFMPISLYHCGQSK